MYVDISHLCMCLPLWGLLPASVRHEQIDWEENMVDSANPLDCVWEAQGNRMTILQILTECIMPASPHSYVKSKAN